MKIQLALDRLTIREAIQIAKSTELYIDMIEVGTSLIKEYGVTSISALKEVFPHKTIVGDIKTMDNAAYEFDLCFDAGADIATVMGVAPLSTIEACLDRAKRHGKTVMIDLLNTTDEQKEALYEYKEAIFCDHISKDEQELAGKKVNEVSFNDSLKWAVAGGITTDSLKGMEERKPDILIIGSAITKAEQPEEVAKIFKEIIG